MALTPAEKQRRYRERQNALVAERPDVIEAALLAEVKRAELGEISDDERAGGPGQPTSLASAQTCRACAEVAATGPTVEAVINHAALGHVLINAQVSGFGAKRKSSARSQHYRF
jgi:hypothetical protein